MLNRVFRPHSRALLGFLLGLGACAGPSAPAPSASTPVARTEPDDSDLWNLVPAEAQTLIAADMAQLRESPWTRNALSKAATEGRNAWKVALGFDEVADLDRLVFASLRDLSEGGSLLVAQGRFDRDALTDAFQKQGQSQPSNYRSVPVLGRPTADSGDGGPALGFLTRRTVLSGSQVSVRAAIDCGFGLARGSGMTPWVETLQGELASRRDPSRRGPAIEAVFRFDEQARARLQSEMGEGGALEHLGVRVDLGTDLVISAVGLVHTAQQAQDMAARLSTLVREQRNRPVVVLLGLRSVVSGIRIEARGSTVEAALNVPEDQREAIVERMTTLTEMLARARAARAAEASR